MADSYELAKKRAKSHVNGVKYFHIDLFTGLVGVLSRCGMEIDQDMIDGAKAGVIESFYGDVEPEWENAAHYMWWEDLKAEWFSIDAMGYSKCSVTWKGYKRQEATDGLP